MHAIGNLQGTMSLNAWTKPTSFQFTRERKHAMFLEHKGLPLLPKSAYIDGLGFGFFAKIRTMVAWVVSENERFKGHILSFHEATNAHMYAKEFGVFWRWCFNVSYVVQNIISFVIQMVNSSYLCTRSSVFIFNSLISFVFWWFMMWPVSVQFLLLVKLSVQIDIILFTYWPFFWQMESSN